MAELMCTMTVINDGRGIICAFTKGTTDQERRKTARRLAQEAYGITGIMTGKQREDTVMIMPTDSRATTANLDAIRAYLKRQGIKQVHLAEAQPKTSATAKTPIPVAAI